MRKLLSKGWYTATVTQAYVLKVKQADKLFICFTIDSGEFAYQHIIREYPINEWGIDKLTKNFLELSFVVYQNPDSELFTEQFLKLRAEIHVDRALQGDVITNVILEMKRTDKDPEYDVTRDKTEEHYHKNNKGRQLCTRNDSGTIKQKQFKR